MTVLTGCGGGGSSSGGNNGNNGGGNQTTSVTLAGRVTDVIGAPLVNATVVLRPGEAGERTTKTTQFGSYAFNNVTIPAGQTIFIALSASHPIGPTGAKVTWTGFTYAELTAGQAAPPANLVLSDPNTQGTISGTVTSGGVPVTDARVYASIINNSQGAGDPAFANLSPFVGYADAQGRYTIQDIPASGRYQVTASAPNYLNQTFASIVVQANQTTNRVFTLNRASSGVTLDPVVDFRAIAITMPSTPTRAANSAATNRGMDALRQIILKRNGLDKKFTAPGKVKTTQNITRDSPAGSNIEAILSWEYTSLNRLYGYLVLRNINNSSFKELAVISDPLAERFTDADRVLTPDLLYYYSVSRLDTFGYPTNGTEGDPSEIRAIQPLKPLTIAGPVGGVSTALPVFQWVSVSRATLYQILVYDKFPDYQSDAATDGVRPLWPADVNNPGSSLVNTATNNRTSQPYQGPALTRGKTYYWAILASDNNGASYTISKIESFVAQ